MAFWEPDLVEKTLSKKSQSEQINQSLLFLSLQILKHENISMQ